MQIYDPSSITPSSLVAFKKYDYKISGLSISNLVDLLIDLDLS